MRPIQNDDLWAAIRGLGMYRLTRDELSALIEQHKDATLFAGKVIAEAARQVLSTRKE